MRRAKRRSSKEPVVPAGSVFAPVIEAAKAMIHVLSTTFDDPDAETRSLRLERIAGMETILVLCTRAAAGKPLDPDTAVMGPLANAIRTPPRAVPPSKKPLTLEERMARLEQLVAAHFDPTAPVPAELPDTWTRPARAMPTILEAPATHTNGAAKAPRVVHTEDGKLRAQDRRLLEVLVRRTRDGLSTTNVELGILSGYSVSSGGFGQALGRLRAAGLIEGSAAENRATSDGRRRWEAEPSPALPTGQALIAHWLHRIKGQDRSIFSVLCSAYPRGLTLEELTKETGYSGKSGGFGQALARLRRLELVNPTGWPMRANATFFEDAN
jgi:hypothetical protein